MNTVYLAQSLAKNASHLEESKKDIEFWIGKTTISGHIDQTQELLSCLRKLNDYQEQLYLSASILRKAGDK